MTDDVLLKWPGVDCEALKVLGARHKYCVPYDAIKKLPNYLYEEVAKALGRLEIIEDCWEYECSNGNAICIRRGMYICAEESRELRPLIMRVLKELGYLGT